MKRKVKVATALSVFGAFLGCAQISPPSGPAQPQAARGTADKMPVKVAAGGQVHYYAFPPKRLLYLNESAEKFGASREWQFTRDVLDKIVRLSRDSGITVS